MFIRLARAIIIGSCVLPLLTSTQTARATVRIIAGDHTVPANQTDVAIPIMMTGNPNELLEGVDLFLQIGDGGAYAGGVNTHPVVPAIVDIDIQSADMVFGDQDWHYVEIENGDLVAFALASVAPLYVDPNGLVATIIIDTTGAQPGATYPLYLHNPNLYDSDIAGAPYPLELVDGSITIQSPPATTQPSNGNNNNPPPSTPPNDPSTQPGDVADGGSSNTGGNSSNPPAGNQTNPVADNNQTPANPPSDKAGNNNQSLTSPPDNTAVTETDSTTHGDQQVLGAQPESPANGSNPTTNAPSQDELTALNVSIATPTCGAGASLVTLLGICGWSICRTKRML